MERNTDKTSRGTRITLSMCGLLGNSYRGPHGAVIHDPFLATGPNSPLYGSSWVLSAAFESSHVSNFICRLESQSQTMSAIDLRPGPGKRDCKYAVAVEDPGNQLQRPDYDQSDISAEFFDSLYSKYITDLWKKPHPDNVYAIMAETSVSSFACTGTLAIDAGLVE
ncbi:hypothetical protein P167DRAFT_98499 [Morchella conica CCBAS932]|uniref:Uncharacterized protein n=1 Tax=Morchella conica CCBAS932 TaxID=1392247 RepID=A0A3N4KTI8_9PEZI|nr:hypothetical protein P167DRAFT_98499 [Morchella conica CCBAS932]